MNFLDYATPPTCDFQIFAAVGGRNFARVLPSGKTLLFAKVCLRVREIREVEFPHPGPPPKHIPYAQMEYAQPYAHIGGKFITQARAPCVNAWPRRI